MVFFLKKVKWATLDFLHGAVRVLNCVLRSPDSISSSFFNIILKYEWLNITV